MGNEQSTAYHGRDYRYANKAYWASHPPRARSSSSSTSSSRGRQKRHAASQPAFSPRRSLPLTQHRPTRSPHWPTNTSSTSSSGSRSLSPTYSTPPSTALSSSSFQRYRMGRQPSPPPQQHRASPPPIPHPWSSAYNWDTSTEGGYIPFRRQESYRRQWRREIRAYEDAVGERAEWRQEEVTRANEKRREEWERWKAGRGKERERELG